jgi:hypothetical protein
MSDPTQLQLIKSVEFRNKVVDEFTQKGDQLLAGISREVDPDFGQYGHHLLDHWGQAIVKTCKEHDLPLNLYIINQVRGLTLDVFSTYNDKLQQAFKEAYARKGWLNDTDGS